MIDIFIHNLPFICIGMYKLCVFTLGLFAVFYFTVAVPVNEELWLDIPWMKRKFSVFIPTHLAFLLAILVDPIIVTVCTALLGVRV